MSERAARAKQPLYQRCVNALGLDERADQVSFFVPGRIELLGKHTDYAGGRSLLCTIERGFIILGRARTDDIVRVTDVSTGETRQLSFDSKQPAAPGDWSTYMATVVQRIACNFPDARRGADIAFASDLPAASGMSSSSALIIASFLVLARVNELASDVRYRAEITSPETLAAYLAGIENGQSFGTLAGHTGVGTQGGSEDHTAILCCRAGFLSQYAFCPVRFEREVSFPEEWSLVVAYSGVAAAKTGSAQAAYNAAAATAQRIVDIWNRATDRSDATLSAALASAPFALEELRRAIAQARVAASVRTHLRDRLEQFVLESMHVVPQAGDALAARDLVAFGEWVDQSQRTAELLLRNQVDETIALARTARDAGAFAASAFGAGFGGSVWALVAANDADRFSQTWRDVYTAAQPHAAPGAEFLPTRPGPPVTLIEN
jgi:galactokinase